MKRMLEVFVLASIIAGCTSYKGGRIVDGTNLEIGLSIPGMEGYAINLLSYTGGMKVCGNDSTRITVQNEVWDTNSYFGVVSTERHTKMRAEIEPLVTEIPTNAVQAVKSKK